MDRSLKAGQRVRLEQVGLFADGAAVKMVGEETFRLAQQYVDRWCWSIPTPSAPRSRMYSRTRRARTGWRAVVAGAKGIR